MIYGQRGRPRYRSISVRTFYWLCRLEAECWVVSGGVFRVERGAWFRWWMAKDSTARRRLAARALGRHPERERKP